ncbi:PREDICTED: zeatin O-glucosyltransferase-like [Nicotiana attenuata]|uniref:zeatin O-glucosyltransferase-like n=1 Tax=Nicotiana attenuata TaxID=49451 RepID=UPI0009056D92|nr:PREDICTED: zeatin O-glucosyltransferase-like [Nicotiana attenuata]
MEAEYVAASEAAKEAVWLGNFLRELGVVPSIQAPITLYCDNSGARGDIVVTKIASENNLADPFTKSLPQKTFDKHVEGMGVKIVDACYSLLVPMATNSSENINHLNEVIVAMVPFPDYSHLNQLFILGRFIASHNIPVHFLCLADRNQDLKLRVQGDLRASNIHFHDILVPSSLAGIEGAGHGLPSIVKFIRSLINPIQRTCIDLSTNAKRFVIIHDSIMMDHVRDVHSYPNVKSYMFHSILAFARYSLLRQCIDHIVDDDDHVGMIEKMPDEFPLLESTVAPFAAVLLRKEHEWKLNSGEIINFCRELEGKYLDLLTNAKDNKPWLVVGPLHMLLESHDSSNRSRHECLEFLDKQDVNSVILVSFGTTTTFSQEQVSELALGLEQSNHKFIWVLREADKKMENEKLEVKDEKIELPKGFEERTEGRGMVVRNWAPQLEILGHRSIGGFLSHCGWNSCIESISMGVPIAACPNNADQLYHAAHREELVTAKAIEKAVKTLMDTTEGEEMRQRAMESSDKIKNSVSRGGLARKEMECFISCIIR